MEEEVKSKVKDLENRLGELESRMGQILPPAAAAAALPRGLVSRASPSYARETTRGYGKDQQTSNSET